MNNTNYLCASSELNVFTSPIVQNDIKGSRVVKYTNYNTLDNGSKHIEINIPISDDNEFTDLSSVAILIHCKIIDSTGKVMYEAEMSKGKEEFDVIFDDKGNFIKKSDPETGEEEKD